MCNKHYVQEEAGNSCAQVITKSHPIFYASGKAVDVSESAPKTPVHFRIGISSSLQYWRAEVISTCASEVLDAADKPMKYITFSANNMHTWPTVSVILDQPDFHFAQSWKCTDAHNLRADAPRGYSFDNGKSWTFHNVAFDPILYDVQSK
ncbi:hypothetical protein EX895_000007 [Sporisorium graminicola]|uniref:Uncharacterized protein n=1 Tax=Sporisorium graminicola TaxID=280036 RepID=A0A4V6EW30_9BASI|nr:hypothetical protein EX895_000007 [Sporisorium graminicola]TKY90009.1 hypothetical protein EX895_000007 [Sporisorium graminicola]